MLEVAVPIASCEQSTLETAPKRKLPGASNKTKPEKVVLKYVVVQLGCRNVVGHCDCNVRSSIPGSSNFFHNTLHVRIGRYKSY